MSLLELEAEPKKAEPSQFRKVLIVVGVVILILVGGGVLWSEYQTKQDRLQRSANLVRAGNPEFDAYVKGQKVVVTEMETSESSSMIEFVYELTCQIENRGDRTIEAIELRGFIYDWEDKPSRELYRYPLPSKELPKLGPNQKLKVRMSIDGVKDNSYVKNGLIEIRGLRFAR